MIHRKPVAQMASVLELLKEVTGEITPALTLLVQTSLDTGIVPADWRTAYVTSVLKKGGKAQTRKLPIYLPYKAFHARPLSISNVVSTIMDYAEKHGLFCREQRGFRKGRCCK